MLNSIESEGGLQVKKRMTITEVAGLVGVSPKTIARWEKVGKVKKPKRDWKGWRFFDSDEAAEIERIVSRVYEA